MWSLNAHQESWEIISQYALVTWLVWALLQDMFPDYLCMQAALAIHFVESSVTTPRIICGCDCYWLLLFEGILAQNVKKNEEERIVHHLFNEAVRNQERKRQYLHRMYVHPRCVVTHLDSSHFTSSHPMCLSASLFRSNGMTMCIASLSILICFVCAHTPALCCKVNMCCQNWELQKILSVISEGS